MNKNSEDAFFCAFKCVTGEEVLAKICKTEDSLFFMVANPIIIREMTSINGRDGTLSMGLSPRKWLTYGAEDVTLVNKNHVVSISQLDKFGIEFYQRALIAARVATPIQKKVETSNNVGYVGEIDSTRNKLERLFDK